jgi:hypothetical protein
MMQARIAVSNNELLESCGSAVIPGVVLQARHVALSRVVATSQGEAIRVAQLGKAVPVGTGDMADTPGVAVVHHHCYGEAVAVP